MYLKKGTHVLSLHDKTGWLSRCAAVVITNDMDFTPSPEVPMLLKQRAAIKGLDTTPTSMGTWEFVIVGAGPGGVPAAISAARKGLKTALICARPSIGGNASDEGTVGFDGAGGKNQGYHEIGIANEIKRVREHWKLTWQGALEYLVANEPNITVFLNEMCTNAETKDDCITSILCTNTITLEQHRFESKLYADCSGDGWLGYYAGAKYRMGREAKHEFQESFAPENPDTLTMSGCTCGDVVIRNFIMEDSGTVSHFIAPDWAVKLPENIYRTPKTRMTSEWWLENSNDFDDLWDSEFARDALVQLGVGYFDWLKNSYKNKDLYQNYNLKQLALHNSKRENRRLVGDYMFTQNDCTDERTFEDVISYHGWGIDVHNIKGIYSGEEGPFHLNMNIPICQIPYRCIYSKNIKNLFVASRCGSFSHLALGSARVENTLATIGQAAGTAAYLCQKYQLFPRDIYTQHIKELQQILLKDDQTIFGIKNDDPDDLARNATVSATSQNAALGGYAENVINGKIRSVENECNAWISDTTDGLPQSLTLTLSHAAVVSSIHITAETDLTYPLYSYQDAPHFAGTIKEMDVAIYLDGQWNTVARIKDNFKRKTVVSFLPQLTEKIRITVHQSTGDSCAIINEIRIYN